MDNPRTDAARANDDSDMIEAIEPGTSQSGTSGGNLATDVSSAAEQALIQDPDREARVTKQDDIAHAAEVRPDRARGA